MKKVIKIILAIVVVLVVSQSVKFCMRESNIKEEIVSSLEQLNDRMPIVLDENTSLTEVRLENNVVVYKAILGEFSDDLIDLNKLGKSQKIANMFFICTNDDRKYFLTNGFDIKYDYYAPNGKSLFGNQISEKDCLPFFDKDHLKLVEYYVDLQRKLLPIKLDSEINSIDVRYSNDSIEFVYELLNYPKEEGDLNVVEEVMSATLLARYCVAPDSKLFLDRGFSIIGTFVDKNGVEVYSLKTDQTMC